MPKTKVKKKVVYLIGTGASHAEIIQRKASNLGLLMGQVTQGIFSKLGEDNVRDPSIKELLNALDTGKPNPYNIDIESVITLYESSGTTLDKKRAKILKRYFRSIVSERTKQGEAVGEPPTLLSVLLDMYSVEGFDEELKAVITLNYDDFIEQAFIDVFKGINYPFEIDKSCKINLNSSLPPLCKLHGSFNWENTNPVKFHSHFASEDEEQVLWVPPGVTKRFDYYPFNAIWASARARLECDILRIIGCSLSRNDWNLIALLHTTNRLRNNIREKYEIQYIDYPESFKKAWHDFSYFGNFKSITRVPEFASYMTAEHKEQYESMRGESEEERMDAWLDAQQRTTNIFAEWLRAMAYNWRIEKGKSISTEKNYFESFFLNGRLK